MHLLLSPHDTKYEIDEPSPQRLIDGIPHVLSLTISYQISTFLNKYI